jgi:hypothetical protein
MNKPVALSPHALSLAEKQARAEGFETVDAYLGALIEQDREDLAIADWMKVRLAEGLNSPNAGPISKEKIERLVAEGIARAPRKA